MKDKRINILIAAFVMISLMAVMLIVFIEDAHDKFADGIKVSADGVTESVFEVRDMQLLPTETKEYTVQLVCEASGSYYIYVSYIETNDGGMKHFVDVRIKKGDDTVYEGKLDELLDTEKIVEFEGVIEADDPIPITVYYTMPGTVGNEAQGTSASFNLNLKIKKK